MEILTPIMGKRIWGLKISKWAAKIKRTIKVIRNLLVAATERRSKHIFVCEDRYVIK